MGVGLLLGVTFLPSTEAAAADRHANYYYPPPTTSETYVARAQTFADSNRKRRIFFVTELTNQMMGSPYPPPFALFAKGEEAEKLIITSLYDNGYNTLYRMRGLLAILTSRSRATPIFQEFEVQDIFTFLDLLKLLGFAQLTVTDGDSFAHQIRIE
ncbi:MAG: molybdopterin-guanine dinucleotide biosynthesis protein A [Gammaproteobacteria bacterium]|nr:molybdopterin-guanine dinucleotide biosynthesis protein A [Gammaproteobacteria bacterium]